MSTLFGSLGSLPWSQQTTAELAARLFHSPYAQPRWQLLHSPYDRKTNGLCLASCRWSFNTLRPRQDGRHFSDGIFKCVFLNGNVLISIKISLKFVPKGPINNMPALVQIMAWRLPGDKPLSEPMMVRLPTHICITRPQWVNKGLPMNYWNV